MVRALRFEGNHALDSYTLSSAISTSNSSWFATSWLVRWLGLGEKRTFDEQEFRRDVVRLVLLYRQSGYMRVEVDTAVRRTAKDVFITFQITEGPPVRVTALAITGLEGVLDTTSLRRELPLAVGQPFDRFLMQASADTIATHLRNSGFPDAEVLRNFTSDADSLRATVRFDAVPGTFTRIGTIQVQGLDRIDTTTVLRSITLHPHDIFRQNQLYESQRDLYGLGLFNSATVAVADTGLRGPEDTLANLVVQVTEGPRHQLRAGAGYGSVDCFRAQAGWTALNFFGGGRSFDLSARVSKIGIGDPMNFGLQHTLCHYLHDDPTSDTVNYSIGATLGQPVFLSPRHRASIGVVAERRSEYNEYVRQDVGANATVTFNALRTVPVSVGYGVSVGRTTANPAVYCLVLFRCTEGDRSSLSKTRRFAAVTVTAVRDQVNSVLDPTRGSSITVNLMHASRYVGSDPFYEFNRGELEVSHYYSLNRSTVFAWRVRGGTILQQNGLFTGQAALFVPPEQRFYGGGPNSVRGYARNGLGPVVYVSRQRTISGPDTTYSEITAEPTGGNTMIVANAELRFATPVLPERMRVALFVDLGQVWERGDSSVTVRGVRVTPGIGLRFTTPLGPVRLDAAYNGYPGELGRLYFQDDSTKNVTLVSKLPIRSSSPAGFWRRVVFQFAVGQAF